MNPITQYKKKLLLVSLYPPSAPAMYLLSSYLLKAYIDKYLDEEFDIETVVINIRETAKTNKICEKILKQKPDIIGYSCYVWNIGKVIEVINNLDGKGDFVHILGGPEISCERIKTLLDPSANVYYVIGEGERTLLHLLQFIFHGRKKIDSEIPMGVALHVNNDVYYKPNTECISDLDEIPSVYLNGVIDNQYYEKLGAVLETQRGCRFKCKYCVYPKNLPTISFYSLERIRQELEYLIIEKQIVALRIFDSIFTQELPRAKKIIRYLIDMKNRDQVVLPWIYWEFSFDMVDDEFLELIAELKYRDKILNSDALEPLDKPQLYSDMLNNYTAINCIGVQSFSREALKAVGRRKIRLDKFENFMSAVNRTNLVLKVDIILGLPYETFHSYFQGLDFFLPFFKNTDHVLNIHRLQILPGSELAGLCDKYKIRYSSEKSHTVFSTISMTEEEMNYASKLSGVLFRILNSPLRRLFFEFKEKSKISYVECIEYVFHQLSLHDELKDTSLFSEKSIDDIYWNSMMFQEIPSQLIMKVLIRI